MTITHFDWALEKTLSEERGTPMKSNNAEEVYDAEDEINGGFFLGSFIHDGSYGLGRRPVGLD